MTRPVRVGIADSGIHPRDFQVGEVAGGIGIRFRDGRIEEDASWEDLLGHGTAVAATIRGHAPSASLYSIRIFRRSLSARAECLLHSIDWAVSEELDLLNLSLGCTDLDRAADFERACLRAARRGLVIVSAAESEGEPCLPGCLDTVLPVMADFELEEGRIRDEAGRFHASPWARRRGELPRERNFHGTSFAVAHLSGIAARLLSEMEDRTERSLRERLSSVASCR